MRRDIRDVEAMAHLNADARRRLVVPESIADAFIGEVFASGSNGAGLENTLATLAIQAGQAIDGDRDVLALMRRRSVAALSTDLPSDKPARRPFHWSLEFPEVFLTGGFDAQVGNPPYLGGPKLTGTFGTAYRDYLVASIANGVTGLADLCAYFLLRASSLVASIGQYGFVVTSAVSEGDSRAVGLEQLRNLGWNIVRATSRARWPGTASVTYNLVWMRQAAWNSEILLDGQVVQGITPMLTEKQRVTGLPKRLKQNQGKSFNGVKVYGNGFVITPEEAAELIEKNPKNKSVIFPYVTTKDVNGHPAHGSAASAIRFFDWPLDRNSAPHNYSGPVAADFPDCLAIVEERVKPERTRVGEDGNYVVRDPMPQLWWIYGEKRPALYKAISKLSHVLAVGSQATKYVAFAVLGTEMVFSHSLSIIADDTFGMYAALNSGVHEMWARHYGGYNLALLRYSPTDLFETFPFPEIDEKLESIGSSYHRCLRNIMTSRQEGLTDTYNRLHDPKDRSSDILELRNLQVEMDRAIVCSYGWKDIDVAHDFYGTSQGERFAIDERSRIELLNRLLELNHKRHEDEVAQGLNADATPRASTRAPRTGCTASSTATVQPSLDFGTIPANEGQYLKAAEPRPDYRAGPAHAIVEYLKAHPGWHAKSDILAATGITDGQWNTAINELIASGKVERQGERRGARYCIIQGDGE